MLQTTALKVMFALVTWLHIDAIEHLVVESASSRCLLPEPFQNLSLVYKSRHLGKAQGQAREGFLRSINRKP